MTVEHIEVTVSGGPRMAEAPADVERAAIIEA